MNRSNILPCLFASVVLMASALSEVAAAPKKGDPVPDQYIVVLDKTGPLGGFLSADELAEVARDLAKKHGGAFLLAYGNALNGYLARLDARQAAALAKDPLVKYVEQDIFVGFARTQSKPVWGLDRIDQRKLPGDKSYRYPDSAGDRVRIYVVDTGIRASHQDFEDRYAGGVNFVPGTNPYAKDGGDSADCNGHGTHVAATAAGERYGVAKRARVVAVRVLGCDGSGTMSGVLAGVDWVYKKGRRPAVANLSLGGGASRALDDAIEKLLQRRIFVVVAAGNDDKDACTGSPGRIPDVITVAASDEKDRRAKFSNWGKCVDLFAPGTDIRSAWFEKDTQYATLSGTSMAAPHVAGLVALYLGEDPDVSVRELLRRLVRDATDDAIGDVKGSPNRLAYTGRAGSGDPSGPGRSQPQPQPQPGLLDSLPLPVGP